MAETWIVVPNQNGLKFLPDCLQSVREHSPRATICFVDNASTDGSIEYVRAQHPDVKLIELEMNLGFVQATNLGLLAGLNAGAESFVLLNNDTRVTAGWLEALESAAADDAAVGVVGAWQNDFSGNPSPRTRAILSTQCNQNVALVRPPATDDSSTTVVGGRTSVDAASGSRSDDTGTAAHLAENLRDQIQAAEPASPHSIIDADWVEGSCLWMRREVLEQIGYLDPLFAPAYFEEVDFCRRARRAGWRVVMATNSIIEHFGAGSSQTAPARTKQRILNERNYLIYHAADPDRHSMSTLLGTVLRRGLKALIRKELSLSEWVKAVAEIPTRMPGIAAKNARDRRNRPCPVLGDRSLSTLEQRYYADRVAEMELTPTRST